MPQQTKVTKKPSKKKLTKTKKKTTKKVVKPVPPVLSKGMQEIVTLLKARTSLIYVVTGEEKRFLEELDIVVKDEKFRLWLWSLYQGLVTYKEHKEKHRADGDMDQTWKPNLALDKIRDLPPPGQKGKGKQKPHPGDIFVLRDFHTVLRDPLTRQLRDLIGSLEVNKKSLIFTAPELGYSAASASGLPLVLDKDIVVVNYDLPTKEDIKFLVEDKIKDIQDINRRGMYKDKKVKVKYTKNDISEIVKSCQGLSMPEIANAIPASLVKHLAIDPNELLRMKEQHIKKSQILEFVSTKVGIEDVGGLDQAKEYFATYKETFTEEARTFGAEPPTGILLTGIPGTGKSLFAKSICTEWKLPGIRLDVGKVMGSLVGQSEMRMREAIKSAEAMAPAVLWIDEIEKAMSGVKSSGISDAGTMSRVFGTFLVWMEEKTADVIVIATANDISQVPPEMIRRFNEVFFVDMPVFEERRDIFKIHLAKRKRDPKNFNLDLLAEKTMNYTGAEIEKSIQHSIASAYHLGKPDTTDELILKAVRETKPIYTVMGEKIQAIKQWARGRARYASHAAELAAEPGKQKIALKSGKSIDIDNDLELGDMIGAGGSKNPSRTEDLILDGSGTDAGDDNGTA